MYGVVTRDPDDLDNPAFERAFYEVKDVTGRRVDPVERGINMVSCHGDTEASANPELVPVDVDGRPATRERRYFDWGYVCPNHEGYRDDLLAVIDRCVAVNDDLRLDDVGFPRGEYCYCDRCEQAFDTSPFDERSDWRASVISGFVADATAHIPGRTYLTVYPDPYPGHLRERSGLDLEEIARYIDEVVVPIYDLAYETTYWIEILASAFADRLSVPFSVELYAVQVDLENLVHAAEVAQAYAEDVYFAYDSAVALQAIERLSPSS